MSAENINSTVFTFSVLGDPLIVSWLDRGHSALGKSPKLHQIREVRNMSRANPRIKVPNNKYFVRVSLQVRQATLDAPKGTLRRVFLGGQCGSSPLVHPGVLRR